MNAGQGLLERGGNGEMNDGNEDDWEDQDRSGTNIT